MSETQNQPRIHSLGIFGQQTRIQGLYTQLCFCLPVSGLSCTYIIKLMEVALKELAEQVPWVAGETEVDENGHASIHETGEIPLEFRMSCQPLYSKLRRANFPFRDLEEKWIAPCRTFEKTKRAVFLAQINFIPHGLLLVFCAQHNVMDMTGMSFILSLLSKLCNGKKLTEQEIQQARSFDRSIIDPLSTDHTETALNLNDLVPKSPEKPDMQFPEDNMVSQSAESEEEDSSDESMLEQLRSQLHDPYRSILDPKMPRWFYFTISNVDYLKAEANRELNSGFVSTDDIVSAFTYMTITIARQGIRNWDESQEVVMARAVDPRSALGIDKNYPGYIANIVYTRFTLRELLELPLSKVAERLRRAVKDKASIARHTRELAAIIYHDNNSKTVAPLHAERDLILSSWAFVDAYNWTFGIEYPEAVRRPSFTPCEGLGYVMPRNSHKRPEDPTVGMCLTQKEVKALRALPLFRDNATYVG